MTWWALIDAEGEVRGQVETDGSTPTEDGSNPGGLEEVRTNGPRDLAAEKWNPGTKRWRKRGDAGEQRADRARRRLERLLGEDGLDLLAEMVAEKLKAKGDG